MVPKWQGWNWKRNLFTPKGFPLKAVFFAGLWQPSPTSQGSCVPLYREENWGAKRVNDGQVSYRVRIGIQVYLLPVHIPSFVASGSSYENNAGDTGDVFKHLPLPILQHNPIIGKVGYSNAYLNDNCHILLKHVKFKSKSLADEK